MVSDFSRQAAHEECRTAVMKAARLSEQLGHHVEEARPSVNGEQFSNAFAILWAASAGYFFKRIQLAVQSGTEINVPWWARWVVRHRSLMSLAMRVRDPEVGQSLIEPFTRHLAGLESRLTPADLWVASAEMHCATRKMACFFQEYDALLTPVLGETPWPIGYLDQTMPVREFRERLYRYVGYTPIANAGGFPAMSVPVHRSLDGVPVGAQFIAGRGREDLLLQLAAQLERAGAWGKERPKAVAAMSSGTPPTGK
jgi:amidase